MIFLFGISDFGISQTETWTLRSCIEKGWTSNIAIQQCALSVDNAGYDLEKNKAAYYPNLNASYTNGFNWGRSIDPTSYQFVNGQVNTNNLSLTSRVILFDGFATPTRIQQSRVGLKLAEGQLTQQKNQIALSIASAYLQLLLAFEKSDLINNQLITTRMLLKNTQRYLELGLKSELEVLQVKAQLGKEIFDSVQVSNTVQLAKLSLMQLMEIPYGTFFEIGRFSPDFFSYSLATSDVLFDSALAIMPEIENADLSVEYNELEVKAQKGGYYPVLSLSGSLGTNYSSSSKVFDQQIVTTENPIGYLYSNPTEIVYGPVISVIPQTSSYAYLDQLNDNFNTAFSINLTIPIYNRNQVFVSSQKAQINVEKSTLERQNQENLLRKDIETDYLSYVSMKAQLNSSYEKLNLSKELYEKMLKQFELESSDSYSLILEKNKVAEIMNEIVQLKYQLLFKSIVLNYYLTGKVVPPAEI